MHQTLVLIKPDAVQRGLTGEILSRFEKRGLKIVAMKMMILDETLAKQHYSDHVDKPFFQSLVSFITSGPIVAIVLEGKNAVEAVRNMMGKTDSLKSAPGTIRGDLGLDVEHNLVHGSDSEQSVAKEIPVFFSSDEIVVYNRAVDPWITAS